MAERYWITGVQLGLLSLDNLCDKTKRAEVRKILKEIDEQFIGRMKEPYENHEIIIRKKEATP